MARKRIYTDEERKIKQKENSRRYRENNREKCIERNRKWRMNNNDKAIESTRKWREKNPDYDSEYYNTPIGRASNLLKNYKRNDKNYNRGECTITSKWIVDNIFNSKCIYCGKTDWTELGCDRIDNSKPHTPDNVVPCCEECNKERGIKPFEEFLKTKRGY